MSQFLSRPRKKRIASHPPHSPRHCTSCGPRRMQRRSLVFAFLCLCTLPGVLGDRRSDRDRTDDRYRVKPGVTESPCREFGYPDYGGVWNISPDCCSPKNQSACANGYDLSFGDVCHTSGTCVAYRTICTVSGDDDTETMFDDAVPYMCEPALSAQVILFVSWLFPLTIACCVCGCYSRYRSSKNNSQFRQAQQPGVQMVVPLSAGRMAQHGYPRQPHVTQHGQPQYGQQPNGYGPQPHAYGTPVQGFTVHQATVQPIVSPQPGYPVPASPQPQNQNQSIVQERGVVRFGRQPMV